MKEAHTEDSEEGLKKENPECVFLHEMVKFRFCRVLKHVFQQRETMPLSSLAFASCLNRWRFVAYRLHIHAVLVLTWIRVNRYAVVHETNESPPSYVRFAGLKGGFLKSYTRTSAFRGGFFVSGGFHGDATHRDSEQGTIGRG